MTDTLTTRELNDLVRELGEIIDGHNDRDIKAHGQRAVSAWVLDSPRRGQEMAAYAQKLRRAAEITAILAHTRH
ncbi:hypothetical protein [Nocardia sp. NPDC051570]|uniref:hypothetical protein n=1 Tax=Nocardia sp. NPDC051570 TaxID=3364324 RepID=UPI003791072C